MPKRIIQIPFPGGSGNVPTGAIQFENDWPGLFLRGDSAIALRGTILGLRQRLVSHPDPAIGALMFQLGQIADSIERDVMIRET
jgi:hypothetical protein